MDKSLILRITIDILWGYPKRISISDKLPWFRISSSGGPKLIRIVRTYADISDLSDLSAASKFPDANQCARASTKSHWHFDFAVYQWIQGFWTIVLGSWSSGQLFASLPVCPRHTAVSPFPLAIWSLHVWKLEGASHKNGANLSPRKFWNYIFRWKRSSAALWK